jgi:hypothetical protein
MPEQGEGRPPRPVVIIESALIALALVSLWPLLWGYRETWHRVWLVLMLGVMVWVASRRVGRIRAAADHAKRMRDEMEKGRGPTTLE